MKRTALHLVMSSLILLPFVSCSSGKEEAKEPVSSTPAPDAPPSQLPEQPASEVTPPPSTEMAPAEEHKKEGKNLDHRKKKMKKKKAGTKSH